MLELVIGGLIAALFGLGIVGLVLSTVGVVLFLVFGIMALAGIAVLFGPLLLVALAIWAILRIRRRGNHPPATV